MERTVNAPSLFVEEFTVISLVMASIQQEIRSGLQLSCNCHSIARAFGEHFSNFRVVDGYVRRIAPRELEGEFGVRAILAVEGGFVGKKFWYDELMHSWLAWKKDTAFLVDLWPLGAVYGCSLPVAHFQDGAGVIYEERAEPSSRIDTLKAEHDAKLVSKKIGLLLDEFGQVFAPVQKTAA